jgi:hypothetical protein
MSTLIFMCLFLKGAGMARSEKSQWCGLSDERAKCVIVLWPYYIYVGDIWPLESIKYVVYDSNCTISM